MNICKTNETNVTVFTKKELFTRLETYIDDKSKYEFVIKEKEKSMSSYLKEVERICNEKIDLLFVNTIQFSSIRLPPFFRFEPKSKMILTIHMTNHWLKNRYALPTKNIFRSLDANLSIYLTRKFILPKYNAINVIYPPIKEHIQKETKYQKPIYTLPFNFYSDKKEYITITKKEKIKFVIPGLIETYRRDYGLALFVFEKLFKKYGKKISLWILGKPVGAGGNKIIARCKEIKKNGFEIYYSKGFVPEQEYDKLMKESDMIFSPLNIKAKRDTGITEIYGKTEGSALPFEAIQYSKPLIVPAEFDLMNEIKSSTIKYNDSDELEKKLIEIIEDNKKLNDIKIQALENSKKFSLKTLQQYFKNEILNKIDIL